MKKIAFRTQARTVDHLGREQIADCPTAITELWKNAYDAYARSVELHIFDGDAPVAGLFDDGHGMSYDEFVNRWLVVGTESKYTNEVMPESDRGGLPPRPKQGQKGIGRLSSANLGPLLLLVSKREKSDFVAALIDWRIFENPFLTLADIKIPVVGFKKKSDIFSLLPSLFEGLTENIWGGSEDAERKNRIETCWQAYDKLILDGAPSGVKIKAPSELVADTIINACFNERHIEHWQLWDGSSKKGTAMLMSGINYDLRAQLDSVELDVTGENARKRFFETLSSFVDPFFDPAKPKVNSYDPNFLYSVWSHNGEDTRLIVGNDKEFKRIDTEALEHVLDGHIDEHGVFYGQVKAFGDWVLTGNDYIIEPPRDLKIHTRKDWKVGSVDIYLATCEQNRGSSSLSDADFDRFNTLAEKYSGFLVFRNSLRVLPYGRVDNDFFEIEMRRSKNAGREFWNARRIFGRLALSRENNPNLKDKAGREGFIDNVATKTLKILIENILRVAARDHFGSDSDLRKDKLPEIQAKNKDAKAVEDRNKLRKKNRLNFKKNLKKINASLPEFVENISDFAQNLEIESVAALADAQEEVDNYRSQFVSYRLPGAPPTLGTLEGQYVTYRHNIAECTDTLRALTVKISDAIQRVKPPNPRALIEKQLQRNAAQIHSRIRKWKAQISELQGYEARRIENLIDEKNKIFHDKARAFPERVENGDISLSQASLELESLRSIIDEENEDLFGSYIRALESLTESIDLELLALDSSEEHDKLRADLDRLNGLAQLGIAVEVLGHELQSYDDMIGLGINKLPADIQKSKAVSDIRIGYSGLTNQLRFLSPLKLSGEKIQKWITGAEIMEYLEAFYGEILVRRDIDLSASNSFLKFRVFDQPSRLLPVFINLVNNSIYWVGISEVDRKILLETTGGEIVVSDNGPGVGELDLSRLFSLFFTKKTGSGRGVGLYLARANLAAGGHKIRYEDKAPEGLLSGANFFITFKGAEYDD
jgi:signal transduction histidine kinase